MPYSKFTLSELKKRFGLQINKSKLFSDYQLIEPSAWLNESLELTKHVSLLSEKAKSEIIVTPVLMELIKRNNFQIAVFSGISFDVNEAENLNGECDFIISLKGDTYSVESPVITLVEAKDDDIALGIPQCIAQMVAARQFNENEGKIVNVIYGCVTTGFDWQFLKLTNNEVLIHTDLLFIKELSNLLGVWQSIIDYYGQNVEECK